MSEVQCIEDPVLGEVVYLAETSKGLPIRVVPTARFRDITAIISFRYGSTDLGFKLDGAEHKSPEGVAHYLEHKLFEDENLHVFDRFAKRGARVNAMTGFAKTSYYFTATSHLRENLRDLLSVVSSAHLTEENVEKERGIIEQEIRMYEDSPDYRGFFDLLGCFFASHPVRHPVGGTAESIAAIDVAELEACYHTYYRTGNAALSVAGPVTVEEVLELAESCDLNPGAAPESVLPDDLGSVGSKRHDSRMSVARPRLLLGYKERELIADPEARRRRALVTRILFDRLFGGASQLREALHKTGKVDDSLSSSYTSERSFGFAAIGCESDHPDATAEVLREALAQPLVISKEDLDRVCRKMLGSYVRSFDAVKSMAFGHADEALDGIRPFQALKRMQSISVDDVIARREELFREDSFAMAVVAP